MRKMIIWLSLVLVAVTGFVAVRQMRLVSTFAWKGSVEDDINRKGMWVIRQELYSDGVTSFSQIYERVRSIRPAATGKIDDPNPFPGILLPGHIYGRVLELPQGMSLDQVPLMWDTKPGPRGWVVVLFWDGTIAESMDESHLVLMLESVKKHGGQISWDGLGGAAHQTNSTTERKPMTEHNNRRSP